RARRSSRERKRCETDPARHSCEHVLQNQRCASTCSSMLASSHPHLGQIWELGAGGRGLGIRSWEFRRALAHAMAFPTSCRRPLTYLSPSLMAPSGSTRQSQSDSCTSIG